MCFSLGRHNRSPTEVELVVFGGSLFDPLRALHKEVILSETTLLHLGMCVHVFLILVTAYKASIIVWVCSDNQ